MIRLSPLHLEQINAQAQAAYPGECCGLLVGRIQGDGTVVVTRIAASENVADPPGDDRFEVSPKLRFDLMRELSGSAEAIVGHYHSHPDHPATPSGTDLTMAFEPQLVWLITAVDHGTPTDTQAWRLNRDSGEVHPMVLVIGEGA